MFKPGETLPKEQVSVEERMQKENVVSRKML
jgi:hypothetical protein